MSRWVNLLALLPNTILTILVISIAFLRFYDQTDFTRYQFASVDHSTFSSFHRCGAMCRPS